MEHRRPGQAPGYADTFAFEPTTLRERSFAIALAAFLTLCSIFVAPFARVKLSANPSLLLVVEAVAIVALSLTASTLFAHYRARRYAPMALLAAAFGIDGLGHVLYVATFPGLFAASGTFGTGSQCAFWTYVTGRLIFSASILAFAYAHWRERRGLGLKRVAVLRIGWIALALLVVLAAAFAAFYRDLPALVIGGDRFSSVFVYRIQPISIVVSIAALFAVVSICDLRTRVSVWLAVTVLAQVLEIVMGGSVGGSRFSVGWYSARLDLAIGSIVFIVAMQLQLAGILTRAARAGTRAHTLLGLSSAAGPAPEINAKLLDAALLELDFEWGFITRARDGHASIEISTGVEPYRDSRSRLESSLLQGITSNELFILENATAQSGDRRGRFGAFASVPVFVDGTLYGTAGFASRAPRKIPLTDADCDFLVLLGILAGTAIERDRRARRLTGLAFFDSLTGLPNRAHLQEHLTERFAHGERYGTPFAIHFLDLDSFKPINDRYGHAVGDEVLREVAVRLRRSVRAGDMVARLGGDEFILVQKLDAIGNAPEALRDRIATAFDEPVATRAGTLTVGVSIGIARYPEDGRSAGELLAAADKAQYGMKHRRRWMKPRPNVGEASRVVPLERRRGAGSA